MPQHSDPQEFSPGEDGKKESNPVELKKTTPNQDMRLVKARYAKRQGLFFFFIGLLGLGISAFLYLSGIPVDVTILAKSTWILVGSGIGFPLLFYGYALYLYRYYPALRQKSAFSLSLPTLIFPGTLIAYYGFLKFFTPGLAISAIGIVSIFTASCFISFLVNLVISRLSDKNRINKKAGFS